MGKNKSSQVVHMEITTEQLMIGIACLSTSIHGLDEWLKSPEKKGAEAVEYCREEKKKMEDFRRVFVAAFDDILAGLEADR